MSASGFLHHSLFVDETSSRNELQILSGQLHKDALTKFFVLSNIRFVSGGSSEMLRTSRCFRIKLFQSDGPRTLAVIAPPLYSLSNPSVRHSGSGGRSPFPPSDKSKSFLKRCGIRDQSIFRSRLGRRHQANNLTGDGRRFQGPPIILEDH